MQYSHELPTQYQIGVLKVTVEGEVNGKSVRMTFDTNRLTIDTTEEYAEEIRNVDFGPDEYYALKVPAVRYKTRVEFDVADNKPYIIEQKELQ